MYLHNPADRLKLVCYQTSSHHVKQKLKSWRFLYYLWSCSISISIRATPSHQCPNQTIVMISRLFHELTDPCETFYRLLVLSSSLFILGSYLFNAPQCRGYPWMAWRTGKQSLCPWDRKPSLQLKTTRAALLGTRCFPFSCTQLRLKWRKYAKLYSSRS